MSDEIKEILDNIQDVLNEDNGVYDVEIEKEILKSLLDCITNLQEENEHNETMLKTYKRVADLFKKDLITMSNLYTKEKLKNKKAVEYINNLEKDYDINVWQEDKHWAYVLYILTGGDKE